MEPWYQHGFSTGRPRGVTVSVRPRPFSNVVRTRAEKAPHISGRYTLLDQSATEELLPLALRHGVPVVLGGPYNSGILAGSNRFDYHTASSERLTVRDRIARLCAEHQVDPRAAALQFAAAHPAVATVIPGTKHPQRAHENAQLFAADIPPQLWDDLKTEGIIRTEAPVPLGHAPVTST